ncbi:hAT family dimerization protein [Ceratobasidium sp. AG-Ba]|nr:hAT family dimerization protein [Ceratobasidium sp. AG-Ba]
MALNPSIRYEWIDQNWSPTDALNAREVVKQHMRRCFDEEQRERSKTAAQAAQSAGVDTAAKRLNKGYASFLTAGVSARPNSALFSSSSAGTSSETVATSTLPSRTMVVAASHKHEPGVSPSDALNDAIVELEHQRFLEEPVIPAKNMENMSPVDYWLARSSQMPLICKLALDLLPAQASSVSSERVFSSSKMTCTQFRNRISASNVEALQILKHALRSDPDSSLDDEVQTLNLMAQHDDELSGHGIICTVE